MYYIDKQIGRIFDKRLNQTYKKSQVVSIVLTGFLLRIRSFNQLNFMIKAGEFNSMYSGKDKIPKIDAIRNSLKSVSLNELCQLNGRIVKKAVRNKVLREGTISGYTVAQSMVPDFLMLTKYLAMFAYAQTDGKDILLHQCTVISLIGDGANMVIDHEMVKHRKEVNNTGEGEMIAARRLLNKGIGAHKGFIEVVIYDALACRYS